jgi:hypothetical protein
LNLAEQRGIRLVQTQPNDPVVNPGEGADLFNVDIPNAPAIPVESARDDT